MQYGNLCENADIMMLFPSFKSYYVVWKPYDGFSERWKDIKFKSYYVVWKP